MFDYILQHILLMIDYVSAIPTGMPCSITIVLMKRLIMMKTIRLKSGVGIWPDKSPPKHS